MNVGQAHALAQERPDIHAAWEIVQATAQDFTSTPEGYEARLSADPKAQRQFVVRRFPGMEDPLFASFKVARLDGKVARSAECTRIGPRGLALLQDGGRFEGFEDANGDGQKTAGEADADDDVLRLMGGLARKSNLGQASLLSCLLSQGIGPWDGALDGFLALASPEFETIEQAGNRASLKGGKPGPMGQILSLQVSVFPGAPPETSTLVISTLSRSAPGS